MIQGVRVTFRMLVKHWFGYHTDYIHTVKAGDKMYWNGGFICAVCGAKTRPYWAPWPKKRKERKAG